MIIICYNQFINEEKAGELSLRHNVKRPKRKVKKICMHCGSTGGRRGLTKDHFLPKRMIETCYMDYYMYNWNTVPLCYDCNQEKGSKIVTPDWYKYISEPDKKHLYKLIRPLKKDILEYIKDTKHLYTDDEYKKLVAKLKRMW